MSATHKTQWNFIKGLAEHRRIPQAMIFAGVEGLGKRAMAISFVKLLDSGEDLILITPEGREIKIEQIRELQKELSLKPRLSDFKAAIIDKAERMRKDAQNCLLKTLEEPKGKALLILITSKPEALLETIRSRCQILKFYPPSFYFQGVDDFGEMEKLLSMDLAQKLLFCRDFFEKKRNLNDFLNSLENYSRLVLLKKLGLEDESLKRFSSRLTENYSLSKIRNSAELVFSLKLLVSTTNVNQKLALENLMLNI